MKDYNMTLDEMKAAWETDCHIDSLNLDASTARTPHLHSKYLGELIDNRLRHTKTQLQLLELRSKKTKYFRGEMSKEELDAEGWNQWQHRTLKGEIEGLIESDPDIQKLMGREAYIKTVIFFLENVLTELKSRSFHCKNILDFQKFRAGA